MMGTKNPIKAVSPGDCPSSPVAIITAATKKVSPGVINKGFLIIEGILSFKGRAMAA